MNDDCYQKEADGFYSMLQSFLLLHKNGLYNYSEVERRLASEQAYSARRNQLFLQIYRKIQRGYERFLFRYRQYDFADMINHAKECVDENPDCACGYKYILLDEVQDLSRNRLLLIRSIINKNPGWICQFFDPIGQTCLKPQSNQQMSVFLQKNLHLTPKSKHQIFQIQEFLHS